MNIFVDEAGIFVIPQKDKSTVSCVGALVLPESSTTEIFNCFEKLKESWGVRIGEIKGNQLNEDEVSSLINLLDKYDIIFQVTAIDMNMQTDIHLTKHRLLQAEKLTEKLTEKHQRTLIKQLQEIKRYLENLTNQLYVQASCTFELLYNVIQKATLYYSQRIPTELGEFYWFIDAKDKDITPFEEFWSKLIIIALQSKSFREPFISLSDGDYSYFEKYCGISQEPPAHIKHVVSKTRPFEFIKIKEIYKKHLRFEQSHANLGIQMVDMLTTSIRRAMNGSLQRNGWENIGKLMVQSLKGSNTIQLINLISEDSFSYSIGKPSYWTVVPVVNSNCKGILSWKGKPNK